MQRWTHTHTHTPGAVDTHTHTPGAVDTHTHTHTHLEQWTHTHTHTHLEQWTHTHTHTHTHLEQWTHTHTHTYFTVSVIIVAKVINYESSVSAVKQLYRRPGHNSDDYRFNSAYN